MGFSSITQPPGIGKRVDAFDWLAWLIRSAAAGRRAARHRARRHPAPGRATLDDHRLARDLGLDVVRTRFGDLSRSPGSEAEWRCEQ